MSSRQKNTFLYLPQTYFIAAVIFALIFLGFYQFSKGKTDRQSIISNAEQAISDEQDILDETAQSIISVLKDDSGNYWPGLERAVENKNIFTQIYLSDSLLFWNSNQTSNDFSEVELSEYNILTIKLGWFLVHFKEYQDYRIIVYSFLKPTNDRLLTNTYTAGLDEFADVNFSNKDTGENYQVYTKDGKSLIGIQVIKSGSISNRVILILFICYVICYLFVLIWISSLYHVFKKYFKNDWLVFIFLVLDILILRLLEYSFSFPSVIKDSYLFLIKFELPASFNSPGDLFISALIVLFISIQFTRLPNMKISQNTKYKTVITAVLQNTLLFCLIYCLFFTITQVIFGLPYDSFYGVSIKDIDSWVSLIALLFLIVGLYVTLQAISKNYLLSGYSWINQFVWIFLIGLIAVFVLQLNGITVLVSCLFLMLIILVQYYFSTNKKHGLYKYLFLLVVFAASISLVVNRARIEKKDLHQISVINILSNSHDNELEQTYFESKNLIDQDTLLIKLLSENEYNFKTNANDYFSTTYFSDLANRYNIQVTICRKNEMLEIEPQGFVIDCGDYFNELVNNSEHEMVGSDLYLITEDPESIYYVASKHIKVNNEDITIYFEFYFTYIPEGLGYPELLVNKHSIDIDLTGYSFARYKNEILVNKFGSYPYLTSVSNMEQYANDVLFGLDNYKHIKHKTSDHSYLIISRPDERLSVQLVTFSVLFVIFLIILFIVFLLLFGRHTTTLFRLSFQSRMQMIFLSTISLIIILLATITLFYANLNNENRIVDQLNEKTNSVIIELQHKLNEQVNFDQIDQMELQYLLRKFSLVFFSDINLYDPSGELISTSRPEIFNRGLLSDRINPMAYEEIFIKNKLFFITQENIGAISYYSSYAPILLSGSQPAGILNLPYFAKQSDVTRSYYLMVFTFINMFVILGIIGTIIAIILSRIIAKPLVVLQENLSTFQIDKRNEVIEWNSDDEIGQLITAYNEMIEKLEYSTELLKQSERESAWREVAQQIAHEIKNPLTPMKLNIQYLEKAYQEKDPGLDEKVKSISEILISQIEALNKVAEMFSDFAKTRSVIFKNVDLVNVINQAVQLYESHSNVNFLITADANHNTRALEKDLLRLFNNLVKNAIYSLKGNEDGTIEISIKRVDDHHLVEILDNGKGIPDELKANIFKPYFTTKSKGTGLGLAIVKNIMNEIGGEISFESTPGTGTRFILKFPVFKE